MQSLFKKCCIAIFLLGLNTAVFAKAIIDADVVQAFKSVNRLSAADSTQNTLLLLVFLHTISEKEQFVDEIKKLKNITIQDLGFMPAVAIQIPKDHDLFNKII